MVYASIYQWRDAVKEPDRRRRFKFNFKILKLLDSIPLSYPHGACKLFRVIWTVTGDGTIGCSGIGGPLGLSRQAVESVKSLSQTPIPIQ